MRDTVKDLLDSGEIKKLTYRYTVKRVALKETPPCQYAVLIEDKTSDPPTVRYETKLKAIPLKYLQLTDSDDEVMLRQEGRTTLAAIKAFHARKLKVLGYPAETLREHCQVLDIGADGVQESSHGSRTLTVVTVRLGAVKIYPYKILNPLIGNKTAKVTPDDILR